MRLTAAAIAFGAAVVATPAAARDFCPLLAIPDELGLRCQTVYEGGTAVTIVEATEQPFSGLNRLRLRELDAPVADPAAWLRAQVSLDLSEHQAALDDFAENPDNPFAPDWLAPMIDTARQALDNVEGLAQAPCEPILASGNGLRWSLRCNYNAVLIQQTLFVELRDPNRRPIAIDYRAANPKRERHFLALINGLEAD